MCNCARQGCSTHFLPKTAVVHVTFKHTDTQPVMARRRQAKKSKTTQSKQEALTKKTRKASNKGKKGSSSAKAKKGSVGAKAKKVCSPKIAKEMQGLANKLADSRKRAGERDVMMGKIRRELTEVRSSAAGSQLPGDLENVTTDARKRERPNQHGNLMGEVQHAVVKYEEDSLSDLI